MKVTEYNQCLCNMCKFGPNPFQRYGIDKAFLILFDLMWKWGQGHQSIIYYFSLIYLSQIGLNPSIHSGDKVQIRYFKVFFISCDLENEVKDQSFHISQ